MESDVRLFKGMITDTVRFLPWADALNGVLEAFELIKPLKSAYQYILDYLYLIRKKEYTTYALSELFKAVYFDFGQESYKPIMKAFRDIAILNGLENSFNFGHDAFMAKKGTYDFEMGQLNMTVMGDRGPINDFYLRIYG